MTLDPERFLIIVLLFGILITAVHGQSAAKEYTAGVVKSGLPDESVSLTEAISDRLKRAGYTVSEMDWAGLCDPSVMTGEKMDLLVIPDSSVLPASSGETVQAYLRQGGNIIALNTPMWRQSPINVGGRWMSAEEYRIERAGTKPPNVVFDFEGSLSGWERASSHMDNPTSHETVADGPGDSRALHVTISNQEGWDTYLSPSLEDPFPEGHNLTVFSARGDERTSQLSVEWTEKDGSRWIAVVGLSREWQHFVLRPQDFIYWESNPARGRGGDSFKPENAERLAVGLAFSHTGQIGGRHEYWIGPIGTSEVTPEYKEFLTSANTPVLDTLSPGYKLFDVTNAAGLQVRTDQLLRAVGSLSMPNAMRSPHPRPRGAGFNKGAHWRWMPLMDAKTENGDWCGSPATLFLNLEGEYKGGVWASFGIDDKNWYGTEAALGIIEEVARRMREGVFLVDGGTNYYTYFDGQTIRLGFEAINMSSEPVEDIVARVRIVDAATSSEGIQLHCDFNLSPGERRSEADEWLPESWPKDGYRAVVELVKNGEMIDQVSHEIHVRQPKEKKEFVTVKDGNFILNGERWRPHGINYMPSSGIAVGDKEYFEYWLSARSYDPEVIERDLRRIKDMGFNSVSIFIDARYRQSQNLPDILRRLDALGMKANLSLRPGTPMDFDQQWQLIKPIIEECRLKDNDTVFAYDLAWEPMFGAHPERWRWDSAWVEWVVEQYGSIENAEKDWQHPIPRDANGKITNPSHEQMESDGEWRRMVAAYRRFLDVLLYEKYGAARRLVLGIDPNHMVSFRMSCAGDPTFNWGGRVPYDFPYLAAAVDILEPEAYGRVGDWEKIKPGWFTFEYSRWAAPDKPMIWSEMGISAWDKAGSETSQNLLDFQTDYYRDFYRMMISSGADGVFFWWYPGGFRTDEISDYGIINPDGSDRPVTKVIREHAGRFINGPDAGPVDHWIEFDRDKRAEGLVGVYDDVKDEFWQAIEDSKTPGLRTAGTGTTSANCPLLAVGNTPYNGTNPPKYLYAAFDTVEVMDADGEWITVEHGGDVQVRSDRPVLARVEITNLGEARLLGGDASGPGTVRVISITENGKSSALLPSDVPHLGSIALSEVELAPAGLTLPTEVVLTFEAESRAVFGKKFRIKLIPTAN